MQKQDDQVGDDAHGGRDDLGTAAPITASHAGASSTEAYRIEVESDGCDHCNAGKLWAVVGPDGVAESTMFEDIEDAESLADALNEAYGHGRARGRDDVG